MNFNIVNFQPVSFFHMRNTLRLLVLCALFTTLIAMNVQSVSAQGLGVKPESGDSAHFRLSVEPGARANDALVISNHNEVATQVQVQVVRAATMARGGVAYPDDSSGPAQWLTFEQPGPVDVAAQGSATLPFQVDVPAGTAPGEYIIGLVITPVVNEAAAQEIAPANAEGNESSFRVNVVTRQALAVILTVPGDTRCEAVLHAIDSQVDRGRWQLEMAFRNTGNVHFRGEGMVTVRANDAAQPIYETPYQIDYFIPGDAIAYPLTPDVRLPEGDYQVEATFEADCGFATSFVQPIALSGEQVSDIAAADQESATPNSAALAATAVDAESARIQAQAEQIRAMGLLLGGIAALVFVIALVVVGVVFILRRRKPDAGAALAPRQGGTITP